MRRGFAGVLFVVVVALGARLFWLNEIAEPFRVMETLITLAVFVIALAVFFVVAKGLKAAPKRPHAAKAAAAATDLNSILAEFEALPGEDTRARVLPAWAMMLRSPFAAGGAATSWFGGLPHAPSVFDWPRAATGQPCNFVAQIDLAALGPGPRPAGVPAEGAMLIFLNSAQTCRAEYVVRFLSPEDMAQATECDAPPDLPLLSDIGFYNATETFPKWPVDLVPYEDVRDQDPPFETYRADAPADWITTWGLAAFEAKQAIAALDQDTKMRNAFDELQKRALKTPMPCFKLREGEHHRRMEQVAPALTAALEAFVAEAEARPPASPVDPEALADILQHRQAVLDISGPFAIKHRLLPHPQFLEQHLLDQFFRGKGPDWAQAVPPEFHAFLEPRITGWRQHRLFGRALPPQTSPDDLRGLDCLISVASDQLLATRSEHEDGVSIWCDRDETARGNWQAGKVVWHTNV